MIKAVVFDFDGTLVESNDIKRQVFFEVISSFGDFSGIVERVLEENSDCDRSGIITEIVNQIIAVSDCFSGYDQKKLIADLIQEYTVLCKERVSSCPYIAGAHELLTYLKINHYYIFLNSGTPRELLNDIIKDRSLEGFFNGIFGKPSTKAENLQQIFKKNRIVPQEVVFVGDGDSDMAAAKETGCHFLRLEVNGDLRNFPKMIKELQGK